MENLFEIAVKQEAGRQVLKGVVIKDLNENIPISCQIYSVSEKPNPIEYFKNSFEARDYLNKIFQGFKIIFKYLPEPSFFVPNYTPKTNFDMQVRIPESENDFNSPLLDSLLEDNRIIVKPVRAAFKYQVLGKAFFASGERADVDFQFKYPKGFRHRRGYGFDVVEKQNGEDEVLMNVARFPIVLSYFPNLEIQTSFLLAEEILMDILEPVRTRRLQRKLEESDEVCEKEYAFDAINMQLRYEEELIANALIRGTARAMTYENGKQVFESGEDEKLHNESVNFKQSNMACLQVKKKGSKEVVEYYGSEDWNLERFLEGDF